MKLRHLAKLERELMDLSLTILMSLISRILPTEFLTWEIENLLKELCTGKKKLTDSFFILMRALEVLKM